MTQAFVADSLTRTTSTSAALQLLKHLKTVLQRDSLKTDLAKMYKVRTNFVKMSCSLKSRHYLSSPTLVCLIMQYCSSPVWNVSVKWLTANIHIRVGSAATRMSRCKKLLQIIFQKYAKDIERVQQHFESCKRSPKLPRNAPSMAGRVLWARQLLMQIELPMKEYVVSNTLSKGQACNSDTASRRS